MQDDEPIIELPDDIDLVEREWSDDQLDAVANDLGVY